jgi:predicted dehydrogenase
LQAAEAGKHILVEKPLALSVAEAEEMIAAAEASNVKFMVGHVLRFRAANREARRIIAEGKIGEPRSVLRKRLDCPDPESLPLWYTDPTRIGNFAIYGYGTHEVDAILWTLNTESRRVFSRGRVINPVWGNQDEVLTILELSNGAMASYIQSLNSPLISSHCVFVGTEGLLSVANATLSLNGETIEIPPDAGRGMADQIHEFARACLEDREPESSARDCLRTQRTLDAMWQSVQTGKVVEIGA